jgi:hypothetical protein
MAPVLPSFRRSVWKRLLGTAIVGLSAVLIVQGTGVRLTAAPLAIHVSGNHLVDGAGATIALHGVDLSGTEFACDQSGGPTNRGWSIDAGQPLEQLSTFQAMAAWNVNVVRVPLNEDCWLGINGVNPAYGGANYQAAIATEVSLINEAGMVAILDLHWSAPGAYAAIAQQPMADADHSIAFWSSVAAAYTGDPAVIFDLYNEPFLYGSYFTNPSQNPWQCWLLGCSLNQFISADQTGPSGQTTGYTQTYTWNTAGMQTLIVAIRSTGASQPILVNGLDWANDDSGWLANAPVDPDGQLIAGAHDYPGESCQTTSCWDAQQAPISAKYPFLVGETGDHTTAPVSFLPTFLPYADSHGWSYLAWTWNPWTYTDDVLITSWNGTPNAGEGTYYLQHLLSLPSIPLPTGTASGTPSPSSTSTPTPSASPAPKSGIQGGINVEPSMRPWHYLGANPQSWWCVMPNCTSDFDVNGQGPLPTIQHEISEAKALGANQIRLEIPWPVVETSRGVFDWTRADAIFSAASSAGITILPVLMWTPQWAGGGAALNQPPTNVSDWTTFVTAFTTRYGAETPAVDVWNEPDSGNYLYNGSAQTYVTDILNPAYSAIKAVDPQIQVVEAGSANDAGACCTFLSAVIADGGQFDIASFHNYAGTWNSEAASYRLTLNAAGRSSTPIWMTEFAVQSASGNQSQALQQVFGGTAPIAQADWYNLRDTGAWTCCGPVEAGSDATWGLLTANFTAKASYATLQSYLRGGSSPPAPTPTPGPTPAPTPTATPTPTPTATPIPRPSPTPSPTGTPQPTPTPYPSADPTPTPNPTLGPTPSPAPTASTGLPFGDSFANDSAGSVPAGWTVSGTNAGFIVANGDGGHGHVYSHNGWTARTVAGSTSWSDYTLNVDVRPSAWASEVDTVDFRSASNETYDAVRFVAGAYIDVVRVSNGVTTELARVNTAYSSAWHHLSITAVGSTFNVSLDGVPIMTVTDSSSSHGAIGFDANSPIEYDNVSVTAS